MENPIKMDDLGVPLFLETPICSYVSVGGNFGIFGGTKQAMKERQRDSQELYADTSSVVDLLIEL